jgi:hypothetical protein
MFTAVYFPAIDKLSRSLVSPYTKADVRRRFFADTTDALLVVTAWFAYP